MKCCICDLEKDENLVILNKNICSDCEWEILKTSVHSQSYKMCSEKLKTFFVKK